MRISPGHQDRKGTTSVTIVKWPTVQKRFTWFAMKKGGPARCGPTLSFDSDATKALLEKHHFSRRSVARSFEAVEVHTASHCFPTRVASVPLHAIGAGIAHTLVEARHERSGRVVDADDDRGTFGNRVLDCRRRVERVGMILTERGREVRRRRCCDG